MQVVGILLKSYGTSRKKERLHWKKLSIILWIISSHLSARELRQKVSVSDFQLSFGENCFVWLINVLRLIFLWWPHWIKIEFWKKERIKKLGCIPACDNFRLVLGAVINNLYVNYEVSHLGLSNLLVVCCWQSLFSKFCITICCFLIYSNHCINKFLLY